MTKSLLDPVLLITLLVSNPIAYRIRYISVSYFFSFSSSPMIFSTVLFKFFPILISPNNTNFSFMSSFSFSTFSLVVHAYKSSLGYRSATILKNDNAHPNLTFAFDPAEVSPSQMAKKRSFNRLDVDWRIDSMRERSRELIGWVLWDLNLLKMNRRGNDTGIRLFLRSYFSFSNIAIRHLMPFMLIMWLLSSIINLNMWLKFGNCAKVYSSMIAWIFSPNYPEYSCCFFEGNCS